MFQSQYFKGSDSTLKKPGLVGQNQWLLRSKDPTAGIFHQVGSKHLCDPRPDHPHALARWGNSVFVKWLVFLNLGGKNNGTMVGWWCFFSMEKHDDSLGWRIWFLHWNHHLMTSPVDSLDFIAFERSVCRFELLNTCLWINSPPYSYLYMHLMSTSRRQMTFAILVPKKSTPFQKSAKKIIWKINSPWSNVTNDQMYNGQRYWCWWVEFSNDQY